MRENIKIINDDCLVAMREIKPNTIDLVYLDPPFYTQRTHSLSSRKGSENYSFDDKWDSISEYLSFLRERLVEIKRVLKDSGSVFFHCDKSASHHIRLLMDEVFGEKNFQSEIIWTYKRWSNGSRGLLPAHQKIYFYSKTDHFKFNRIETEYSLTTNVDQILQKRTRDSSNNKSTYSRDEDGNTVASGEKNGVPLSDVWSIPFLNPKAKERTGYPTQKPILLLDRIISLATNPGDLVLDPFCGSGTTLISAKLLNRQAVGIDLSPDACKLTSSRLDNPIKTESNLLKMGAETYRNEENKSKEYLTDIPHFTVHRNSGIDALLKATIDGVPIPVRIQREDETIYSAGMSLYNSGKKKGAKAMILICTSDHKSILSEDSLPQAIKLVNSSALSINRILHDIKSACIQQCDAPKDPAPGDL